MKRTSLLLVLLVAFFAACGGGGESFTVIGNGNDNGGVIPPPPGPPPTTQDLILEVKQVAANGFFGDYELTLNFASGLPVGTKFYTGNIFPNREWDDYPVGGNGKVLIHGWPNGGLHEFSYGTTTPDNVSHWVDASKDKFAFPPDAKPSDKHLGIVLGERKVCSVANNTGDNLITAIENRGGDLRRIYFDPMKFSDFAMRNYQRISLIGQNVPNGAWVDHAATDAYPCFYTELNFPSGEMEFSLYVIKEDGSQEWVDPSLSSKFHFNDHLRLQF